MDRQTIIRTNALEAKEHEVKTRFNMIDRNIEHIETAFDFGRIKFHTDDLVVLVLDMREGLTKAIQQQIGSDKEFAHFQKTAAEITREGNVPTTYLPLTRWEGYKLLTGAQRILHRVDSRNPQVSQIVEKPREHATPGHYFVLAWSKGKQIAELEIPATATA